MLVVVKVPNAVAVNLNNDLASETPSISKQPSRPPRLKSTKHLSNDHVYEIMVALINDEDHREREELMEIALQALALADGYQKVLHSSVLKTTVLQRYRTGTPQERAKYLKALDLEIRGLINSHIGHARHPSELTPQQLRRVVMSMVDLKEKIKPDGMFDKLKARLVALGNRQHSGTYGDTYAPTVSDRALSLLQAYTTAEDAEADTYDVPQAFLQATISDEHTSRYGERHVRLSKEVAAIWIQIQPEDKDKVASDGTLIIELNRFLYGFKDSPQAFYALLKGRLEAEGFTCLISDTCVFYKRSATGYIIVLAHVDDLWSTWKGDRELKQDLERALSHFGTVQAKSLDNDENYVGLKVERDRRRRIMYLSQPKHMKSIAAKFPDLDYSQSTPTPYLGGPDKFTKPPSTEEPCCSSLFLSKLMYLMYAALKTRWDLLYACTYMALRIKSATKLDMDRLDYMLVYGYNTAHYRRILNPINTLVDFYADASFATLPDGFSMGAHAFRMGRSTYSVKIQKLRPLSMSSTDAEYNILSEAGKQSEWTRNFLSEIGQEVLVPTVSYQDNKSTITLANTPTLSPRSKHAFLRYAYVKEQIQLELLQLEYCPTADMIADVLTKPMAPKQFIKAIRELGIDITLRPAGEC